MFVYKYSHYTSNRVSAISHRHMAVPIVLSQSKSLSRAPLADFGVNFILFSIIPLKQKIGNSQCTRNSLKSAGCIKNVSVKKQIWEHDRNRWSWWAQAFFLTEIIGFGSMNLSAGTKWDIGKFNEWIYQLRFES